MCRPPPHPEKPRGSWKGVQNGWQGCQELLTLLILWLGARAMKSGEKLHVGAFGKDRCPDVQPGQMVLLV